VLAAAWVLSSVQCTSESAWPAGHFTQGWEASRRHERRSEEPIEPLPRDFAYDAKLAKLGQALFSSPLLSGDGRVSCASCHLQLHGMADGKPTSELAGRPGPLTNSPTLYNVRYLDALLPNPRVLGTSWAAVVARLGADVEWVQSFRDALGSAPDEENVRQALINYELSLVTPDAPFDRWLRGDEAALSADARQGYTHFESYGCSSCHQGVLVGGNMFQRLGVMREYFDDPAAVGPADWGRYDATGREEDRYVFRVPSLRNVSLTGPYLHDGSSPTLESVISVMATYQLGRSIEPAHARQIVAFLVSLTGEYEGKPL
jgi:cytochrome c peroxidase